MSNPKYSPLNTRAYRKLRTQLLATATHCAICHEPLDHTAQPGSRWAPTLDHITPISQGGHPLDPFNLRPAHKGCNSRRGNTQTTGKGSRRKRTSATSGWSRAW